LKARERQQNQLLRPFFDAALGVLGGEFGAEIWIEFRESERAFYKIGGALCPAEVAAISRLMIQKHQKRNEIVTRLGEASTAPPVAGPRT
jgi:hypothetical protein